MPIHTTISKIIISLQYNNFPILKSFDSPLYAILFNQPSTAGMERTILTINSPPTTSIVQRYCFLFITTPNAHRCLLYLKIYFVFSPFRRCKFLYRRRTNKLTSTIPKSNRALPIRHNNHAMRSRHNDVTIQDKDLSTSLISNTQARQRSRQQDF